MVFFYLYFVITVYMLEVYRFFYVNLLGESNVNINGFIETKFKDLISAYEPSSEKIFKNYLFSISTFYVFLLFTFLFPFLVLSRDIREYLNWEDDGCFCRQKISGNDHLSKTKTKHSTTTLSSNLTNRIACLFTSEFWKCFWFNCVFSKSHFRSFKKPVIYLISPILYVFRLIFYLIALLVYVTPATAVLTKPCRNVLRSASGCGRIFAVFSLFFTVIGFALIYCSVSQFVYLLCQMSIFMLIDISHNIGVYLYNMIFFLAIVLYVRSLLTSLDDDYRGLKLLVFQVSQNIVADNAPKKMKCRFKTDLPLLSNEDDGRQLCVPKEIYDTVCEQCLPLRLNIFRQLRNLVMSLACIGVIFTVVIYFNLFDSFSNEGKTMLTLLTAAFPRLCLLLKSSKKQELKNAEMVVKIKSTILAMTYAQW